MPENRTAADREEARHIEIHQLVWQGIAIQVSYEADWLNMNARGCPASHLQIESVAPDNAPLPMTGTGYRSHFTDPEAISAAGGPVAYALAWLEHEAAKPEWREKQDAARQMTLF